MNPELDTNDIGQQLGTEGVNGVLSKAEKFCAYEERRIALENHAPIVALRAKFSLLAEEERRLKSLLRSAPPPCDLRHHRQKAVFYWTVAAILTVTGFFLAVLTFAPFRLGWQGYLFCLGIATVVPFLVEKLLADVRLDPIVKTLTAIAAVAGVVSLMLLADVRGHLLAHGIEDTPTVVIDDSQPEQAPPDDFYHATLGSLRLATVLLSLAMELGAGLALREAWGRSPHSTEDWTRTRTELSQVEQQLVVAAHDITRLEDEPAIFKTQFWRDFYKSMLLHTVESAIKKLLFLAMLMACVPHLHAQIPSRTEIVIALDLTKSEAVKGPDGTSEFEKNVDGVTRVLGEVPGGAHITVIGITDRSFALPYILLSASTPEDEGYFGEKTKGARMGLVKVWKERSAKLQPTFHQTDILGALALASQIFSQRPQAQPRILILLSDMRNQTGELNQGQGRALGRGSARNAEALAFPLYGVQVHALGVDAVGQSTEDWGNLNAFWRNYLGQAGAKLDSFSPLRALSEDQISR